MKGWQRPFQPPMQFSVLVMRSQTLVKLPRPQVLTGVVDAPAELPRVPQGAGAPGQPRCLRSVTHLIRPASAI